MLAIAAVLTMLGVPGDLDEAGVALTRTAELIATRGLDDSGGFELTVEAVDPALGGGSFPGGPPSRRGEPGDVNPLLRWDDAAATRADRSRFAATLRPPGLKPLATVKLFDGADTWIHDPDRRSVDRFRGASERAGQGLGYYRDLIGYPVEPAGTRGTAGDSGEPYRLDRLVPSGRYAVAGREAVDGIECVILERPGLDRLWLAPGLGWAPVRREWRWAPGGPLKRRIALRDFRAVGLGLTLPFAGSMEIYGTPATRPGRRVGTLRATMRAVAVDVPAATFAAEFPPGTVIRDAGTGENTLAGPDPGAAERSRRGIGPMFRPDPWHRRPGVRWGMWAGLVAAVAAGVAWRRRIA